MKECFTRIAMMMVIVIMLCLLPCEKKMGAYAQGESFSEGKWMYKHEGNEISITGYLDKEYSGTLEVPGMLGGLRVTTIYSLAGLKNVSKVLLPETVKMIYSMAFSGNKCMKEINFPENLEYIGPHAFRFCNIHEISFPFGREIKMDGNPFVGNPIERINVSPDHPNLAVYQGVLFDKKRKTLLAYPGGNADERYVIPESIVAIGDGAFEECEGLKSVMIPDSVKIIGSSAFSYSGLEHVSGMKNVTEIGSCAFEGTFLEEITLSSSVERISEMAFERCGIRSISLNEGLKGIGGNAFCYCPELEQIFIPESVEYIGAGAFQGCAKLERFEVAEGNTKYISVDDVLFGKDMSVLCAYPAGKRKAAYFIPEGTKHIDSYAFTGTQLYEIYAPNSLRTIGGSAFSEMKNLREVRMNDGILAIGDEPFMDDESLRAMRYPASIIYGMTSLEVPPYAFVQVFEGTYPSAICDEKGIDVIKLEHKDTTELEEEPLILPGFSGMEPTDFLKQVQLGIQTAETDEEEADCILEELENKTELDDDMIQSVAEGIFFEHRIRDWPEGKEKNWLVCIETDYSLPWYRYCTIAELETFVAYLSGCGYEIYSIAFIQKNAVYHFSIDDEEGIRWTITLGPEIMNGMFCKHVILAEKDTEMCFGLYKYHR